MSYILEALKKSDQQRQRGLAPTLPPAPVTVFKSRQPIYYGLFAAALLFAGIAIGWLRPWQTAPENEHIAAKPSAPSLPQAAPSHLPASLESVKQNMRESLPQNPTTAPTTNTLKPDTALIPAHLPEKPADPVVPEPIPMSELPASVQQELPAISVQLHAYSNVAAERLVSINSRMLREGESLSPGLKLEQVTPDGMIFSFRGYRFQHGVR